MKSTNKIGELMQHIYINGKDNWTSEDIKKIVGYALLRRYFRSDTFGVKERLSHGDYVFVDTVLRPSSYFDVLKYKGVYAPVLNELCKESVELFLKKKAQKPSTAVLPKYTINLVFDVKPGELTKEKCQNISNILAEMRKYTTTILDVTARKLSNEEFDNLSTIPQDLFNYTLLSSQDSYDGRRKNGNFVFHKYKLTDFIQAYANADEFLDSLKDKDLTPFEKYILIHDHVANRIYTNQTIYWDTINNEYTDDRMHYGYFFEHDTRDNRRFTQDHCVNLIGSLITDNIICGGYAKQMAYFCERVGIQCEEIASMNINHPNKSGHKYNIVHIKDDKYNINSTYLCDACWDSRQTKDSKEKIYLFAFLPMQDIKYDDHRDFFPQSLKIKYSGYQSQIITLETVKKAIASAYKKIGQKPNVDADMEHNISLSYVFDPEAENCFNQAGLQQALRPKVQFVRR